MTDTLRDTSPGPGGTLPLKKVLRIDRHPTNPRRKIYLLECGHRVDRATNYAKQKAACQFCPPIPPRRL